MPIVDGSGPSLPPKIALTSSTDAVEQFGEFTLSWSVKHAESCEASSDWSGAKATSGTETISPTTVGTK